MVRTVRVFLESLIFMNLRSLLFFSFITFIASVTVCFSDYDPSLFDLQKQRYRNSKWDEFFGTAVYYRRNLISSKADFDPGMIALEAMALAKHCYWVEADSLIKLALRSAKRNEVKSKRTQALEVAENYIQLLQRFKKVTPVYKKLNSQSILFSEELAWKMSDSDFRFTSSKAINPNRIRVSVKSRCEK